MVNKNLEGKKALVLNGHAKSVKSKVFDKYLDLYSNQISIFTPKDLVEAREVSQQLVEEKYKLLISGGGDGTLYKMWNFINDYIEVRGDNEQHPLYAAKQHGTGNAIARQTGANKDPSQLESLLNLEEVPIKQIPLIQASVNKRDREAKKSYFSFMGVGWDALILNKFNSLKKKTGGKIPGAIAYTLASIPSFFSVLFGHKTEIQVFPTTENVYKVNEQGIAEVANITPGQDFVSDTPINVAGVGTLPYLGFGFKAFPYANLAEEKNLMQLTIISGPPRKTGGHLLLPWNTYKIWTGNLHNSSINYFLAEEIKMEYIGEREGTEGEIAGDALGKITSMTCSISNKMMNMVDFSKINSHKTD